MINSNISVDEKYIIYKYAEYKGVQVLIPVGHPFQYSNSHFWHHIGVDYVSNYTKDYKRAMQHHTISPCGRQAVKSFAEIYRDSSNNISVIKGIFPVFYHS